MKNRVLSKLIAVMMTMTMIMGMSMTVYAEDKPAQCTDPSHQIVEGSDPTYGCDENEHWIMCTGGEGYLSCEAHSFKYESDENGNHYKYCEAHCGYESAESEACSGFLTYTSVNSSKHSVTCSKCNASYGTKSHDKSGSGGSCSKCGYIDSSSHKDVPEAHSGQEDLEQGRLHLEAEIDLAVDRAYEAKVKKEESIPASALSSASALSTVPSAVKILNSDTYNISEITTVPGFVTTIDKISKSTVSDSVNVYSEDPLTMNQAMINGITNTGKEFVYSFNYNDQLYSITIPADKNVVLKDIFAGPLAIGGQLGTTRVISINDIKVAEKLSALDSEKQSAINEYNRKHQDANMMYTMYIGTELEAYYKSQLEELEKQHDEEMKEYDERYEQIIRENMK